MENISSCVSTKYSTDKFFSEREVKSTHIFRIIFYAIMFLFGVTGNCLVVRVYWTKTVKTSTHFFIMALAAADLTVCLMHVFNVLVAVYAANKQQDRLPHALGLLMTLKEIAILTSVLITAVIAADRYDCICRHPKRFFTLRRSKITLVVSLSASLIMSIPSFTTLSYSMELLSQTMCFLIVLLMISVCYTKVYAAIKKHVRVGEAPSTQVELSNMTSVKIPQTTERAINPDNEPCCSQSENTHIVPSVSLKSQAGRQSGGDSTPRCLRTSSPIIKEQQDDINVVTLRNKSAGNVPELQRKTTRMLCITSVVFLLTWLPYWIFIFLTSLLSLGVCLRIDPHYFALLRSIHVLLYINNAVNPLIYGLANRRFRKDCKEVLRKMRLC